MKVRTELTPLPLNPPIRPDSKILSAGSCFAENIGLRFTDQKMDMLVNPFGIIFNPLSIFELLTKSLTGKQADEDGYLLRDEKWYHREFHSRISGDSRDELAEKTCLIFTNVRQRLQQADWIIITPGTAIVYDDIASGKTVANCHKLPSADFRKRMLSVSEVTSSFLNFDQALRAVNPDVKFLFTVSPVRHIKDSIPGNSLSKSTLLVAVNQLVKEHEHAHYFPAYELMLDDLRDYRYYKDDMIHPSPVAEEYIWNKLVQSAFSPELQKFISDWDKIRKSLAHRPFNSHSAGHQQFLSRLLEDLYEINKIRDVSEEISEVKSRLNC